MHLKYSPPDTYRSPHSAPHSLQSRRWRAVQSLLKPPARFLPAVLEAIAWIASAVALRLLGEIVLVHLPYLGAPVVLLLLCPAAIAIGLSTWVPSLSFLLGYRLILIAFGLLLGGKL